MSTELLFEQAKNDLASAKEKLSAEDLEGALASLTKSNEELLQLIELVWRRKRSKILEAHPPGENVQ